MVSSQFYPVEVFLLWIALFYLAIGGRLADLIAVLPLRSRSKRFVFGAAMICGLCGLGASVFLVSLDAGARIVVILALGGTTAVAALGESGYFAVVLSYSLAAVVVQAVSASIGQERGSIWLGLMLTAYVAAISTVGYRVNGFIVRRLRLRLAAPNASDQPPCARAPSKAVVPASDHIYQHAPVGLCLMDPDYRVLWSNEHMAKLIGLPMSLQIGRTLGEVVPDLADQVIERCRPMHDRGESILNAELRNISPQSSNPQRHWLANFFPVHSNLGEITGLIGAVIDISTLNHAQTLLRESENRFRTIFDSVNDIIFVYDVAARAFVEVNQCACETFGYSREELLQLSIDDLSENIPPHTIDDVRPRIERARLGMPQTFEWRGKTRAGRLFWVEVSLRRAACSGSDLLLATARDISRRKQEEEQLKRLAQLDVLTGLANRGVFVTEVGHAIEKARRGGGSFAVLYLDLDHFKRANDTLGHPVGDRLLRAVADRVQATVRQTDLVARFGGDEFALLLTDISEPTQAAVLASKLLEIISKPFLIDGNAIHTGTSIGIAMYEPDTLDPETLLSGADVALYRAKSEGRNAYRFFTEVMDAEVRERVTLTSELRAGIAADELFLMYQPQLQTETARVVGLEALVRWQHPTRGVLLPCDFVPAAERNGLIVALGNWVLRAACVQAKRWLDAGIVLPAVAINVSALQFKAGPCELEREIAAVLADTGVPPGLLELELTETAIMDLSFEHRRVLERLRAKGLRIVIDDFGTGYSSLHQLRSLPVSRIKVAAAFVSKIGTDPHATAIAKAAIGLARELDLDTIAEGVETTAQLQLLHHWGCREIQGLCFAKAMTAAEVTPLLSSGNAMRWLAARFKRPGRQLLSFLAPRHRVRRKGRRVN